MSNLLQLSAHNNKDQSFWSLLYYVTMRDVPDIHSVFKPQLTPKEMLEMGIFGGLYFETIPDELPKSWFKQAKLSSDGKQHKELNFYGILASQPRHVWEEKGWIHKDDPLGWFQWYCRYHQGRRHADDERQIKRWKAISRHIAQISHNCRPKDQFCRPRQRQAILQWAYDPRRL